MSDMYESGIAAFTGWHGNMREFWTRWLGDFNAEMTADEANRILHEGRITTAGQEAFARGWKRAQGDLSNAQRPRTAEGGGK